MSTNTIHYVIMALTIEEVDEVINELDKNKLIESAKWLEKNKKKIYGEFQEDWKPFCDKKIADIIADDSYHSNTEYMDQTELLSDFNSETNVKEHFEYIRIFFVDIFALYLDKYIQLAHRCDGHFCNMHTSNCCFFINYTLPNEVQEELESMYKKTWPSISKEYINGSLHRMAVRVDDVKNFKNFLTRWPATLKEQYGPNPANLSRLSTECGWGKPQSCPHLRSDQ